MEIRREVRLQLAPTPARETALRRTLVAYAVACATVRESIAAGVPRNYRALQRAAYYKARERSGLPAQLTICAIRDALRGHEAHVLSVADTMLFQGGARPRDFRLLSNHRVKLSTLDGRLSIRYTASSTDLQTLAEHDWIARSARLHGDATLTLEISLARPLDDPRFQRRPPRPSNQRDRVYLASLLDFGSQVEQNMGLTLLTMNVPDAAAAEWVSRGIGGEPSCSDAGHWSVLMRGPLADRLLEQCQVDPRALLRRDTQIAQPQT